MLHYNPDEFTQDIKTDIQRNIESEPLTIDPSKNSNPRINTKIPVRKTKPKQNDQENEDV